MLNNRFENSCFHCCLKHLSQAYVLYEESMLGYPLHIHLCKGHLAEAASEVMKDDPEWARALRMFRLSLDNEATPNFLYMIEETERRMKDGKDTSH